MPKGERSYVIDPRGNRIEIETTYDPLDDLKSKKRKQFKVNWVKYPASWDEALRGSSGAAHDLAYAIIAEAFKRAYVGGEVKLSAVTHMQKATRAKAARELVKLGLIRLHRENDGQSYKVTLTLPSSFSFKGDR